MANNYNLVKNQQLDGDPFFWESGPIGVLLIHGFTATTTEIRPLAKALLEHNYTVSGPVLPGHNTYPEDINNFKWQDWYKAVSLAYQELANRVQHVIVGGESTGGLLGLYLAAKHANIRGVVTYAPALKLNLTIYDQFKLRLFSPFIPYLQKTGLDNDLPWKGYTVNPLKGVVELLKLQKQVKSYLNQIQQPILIVQGRLDTTVDPGVPLTISNGVRSMIKEIHWMENSGHCVALDCEFDQVTAVTLKFLEKLKSNFML